MNWRSWISAKRASIPGIRALVCGLSVFFLMTCPAFAAAEGSAPVGVIGFLRGHTWQFFMDLFNFFVLMLLLWKFVFNKLLLPAVDEGLSDIETRLSQEESQKQAFERRAAELKESIANLGGEEERILSQAKEQSEMIREQIMESAREQELRVLSQADTEAAAVFNEGLNTLKEKFFSELTEQLSSDLKEDKSKSSLEKYQVNTLKNLGGKK